MGRLRRAIPVGDCAHLDRRARKHTGGAAAEADGLCHSFGGVFGCCINYPTNLLDESCERWPALLTPVRPPESLSSSYLAMDHGLCLRHRQHASRGNPSHVLQLGVSKLARDSANCCGRPVWRRRGCGDQCRLAHCMPDFDPVACVGSAWSSDHRDGDLRGTHRAFFRKSQIARRRQTFLSAGTSPKVNPETPWRRKNSHPAECPDRITHYSYEAQAARSFVRAADDPTGPEVQARFQKPGVGTGPCWPHMTRIVPCNMILRRTGLQRQA
jgi:hypothetical protein